MASKKVNAYAIHAISTRIAGKKTLIPASTRENPSVFITTEEELKALEALGAAREALDDEVAITKHRESIVDATVAAPAAKSSVGDERPASGAEGDPQGKPNGGKPKGGKSAAEGAAENQGAPEEI